MRHRMVKTQRLHCDACSVSGLDPRLNRPASILNERTRAEGGLDQHLSTASGHRCHVSANTKHTLVACPNCEVHRNHPRLSRHLTALRRPLPPKEHVQFVFVAFMLTSSIFEHTDVVRCCKMQWKTRKAHRIRSSLVESLRT